MSDGTNPGDEDSTVVGVPAETPEAVRPSTTGLVPGPLATDSGSDSAGDGLTEDEQAVLDAGGERLDAPADSEPKIQGPNPS